MLNILHITDLHLRPVATWDESFLLEALLADLARIKETQFAPKLIVFSGDVAMAGGGSAAYEPVLNYLLRILEALGLDETKLVLCPGNHDLDRGVAGANLLKIKDWRTRASSLAGANALLDDTGFLAYRHNAFESYDAFAHEFAAPFRTHANALAASYYMRDLGLGIVALNTASLSGGGLGIEFADRGNLCVPERALIEALLAVPEGVPVIVLGHHPISWMNDSNAGMLESILAKSSTAYLHGHLHETSPRHIAGLSGSYLAVQSGGLHTKRDYWNGYALISLDLGRSLSRIAYRRWFEQRREFGKAEDIGDEGIFYGCEDSRKHWSVVVPRLDPAALESWRQGPLLGELRSDYERFLGIVAGDPDPFVPPRFDREVPFIQESKGHIGSRLEISHFEELVISHENIVISAAQETGKTTVLKRMAVEICQRQTLGKLEPASVPIYIHFSNLRNYSSYIETLIRQRVPDLPDGCSVRNLLEAGVFCILVDDVDFGQKETRDALTMFIKTHPKCRYVFTSSTVFVESAALRPEIVAGVPFSRVRLRQIEDRQLLTLIENHGTTDPLAADLMLSRVLRDANALNVPLTAVTGTFLIQILIDDPDHTILNQAALIERYVEMLLQKYAPRELLPGTFDFKNKVDLLSYVAERMVHDGDFSPQHNTLVEWCIEYLRGYGLSFSAIDLIDYFVKARIFERVGDQIAFRLRMFFEFFAAIRMVEEEDFRDFVFSDGQYLKFANEIGFYAALNRKDKHQLDRIYRKFEELGKSIFSVENGIENEDKFFENFKIPGKETTEAEIFAIQQKIASAEQIQRDREELLGEDTGNREFDQQGVVKEAPPNDAAIWVGHLWLLSRMIKHMELIPDADKRRLLSGILQGWVRFAANSMSIAGIVAKDRRVVFHGVTYISTLPDTLPVGEVARRITLTMPAAVARMAGNLLGTEKLRDQLEEGLGTADEPPTRQLMRVAILADLGTPTIAKLAGKVSTSLRGHAYLQHALARKLYEVAVRFRLPKSEVQALQALVSKMFIGLEHVPEGRAGSRASKVIGTMARQRLLLSQATKARGGDTDG